MELFLSSYEYGDFKMPRRIIKFSRTVIEKRNALIIEVDEPLIGQNYGYGEKDITLFYLINRVDETAFEKLNEFPIDVHILIPKGDNKNVESLSDLTNIAWANLYDNKTAALQHKIL